MINASSAVEHAFIEGVAPLPRTKKDALRELELLEAEVARRMLPSKIEASLPPKVRAKMLRPSRYKGMHGGRGSAKSESAARILVAKALREPGLRWLCAREVQLTLRESVKRLLEEVIEEFGLQEFFTIYDTKIVTPGDGVFNFAGLQNHTSHSIKSLQGYHGCWVEEAQTLSKTSLKHLRPTFRAEGSEIWFTWNPESAKDPVDELLRGVMPPKDSIVIELNYTDNPYFPQILRDEMERDYARDPEDAAHVWGGKYAKKSNATVFKNYRVARFETPADAAFLFGGDWGFSVDPTVLVRCFEAEGEFLRWCQREYGVGDRVLCIDAAVYAVGCEIDDTPALFDKIDPARPCMAREWEIIADSARPETISYMRNHGYPRIEPAKKGAGSVEEGVKFLQSYDVLIHPDCCHQCGDGTNHVSEEFGDYKFKVHPKTLEVMPALEDKKNHVIDAARYAVEKLHLGDEWIAW